MTPEQHIIEAERLLSEASTRVGYQQETRDLLAHAGVHFQAAAAISLTAAAPRSTSMRVELERRERAAESSSSGPTAAEVLGASIEAEIVGLKRLGRTLRNRPSAEMLDAVGALIEAGDVVGAQRLILDAAEAHTLTLGGNE